MYCDLHADTPTRLLTEGCSFSDPRLGVNLSAVKSLDEPLVQLFAVWHDPEHPDRTDLALEHFLSLLPRTPFVLNGTPDVSKPTALLGIEGGNALQKDPDRLEGYFQKGVRFLTLVWNGDNDLAAAHDRTGGLTPLGREVLKGMNALGMVADLAHANEETFWEVASHGGRLFCSHTNARAVCDHTRNLRDDQIRAVIQSDGIMGLTLYPPFVGGDTLADLLPHIEHICSLGGAKNLAIGSDLDGIDVFLKDGEDCRFFPKLRKILAESGVDSQTADGILGKNFFDKFCNF